MCKYCDNIKEEIDSLERQDTDLLGQQGVGTDLIIVKKDDKYYFNVIGSFDSVKESVEIEFCPVCGRKLDGNLSNYTVTYYENINPAYNPTSNLVEEAWRAVPSFTGYTGSSTAAMPNYATYRGSQSNEALLNLINTVNENMNRPTTSDEYQWSGGTLSAY